MVLQKYHQVCKGMGIKELEMIQSLKKMDVDSHTDGIVEYLAKLNIFETITLDYYNSNKDEKGYKGKYRGYYIELDKAEACLLCRHNFEIPHWIEVMGYPKIITSRNGRDFCLWPEYLLQDTTILSVSDEIA